MEAYSSAADRSLGVDASAEMLKMARIYQGPKGKRSVGVVFWHEGVFVLLLLRLGKVPSAAKFPIVVGYNCFHYMYVLRCAAGEAVGGGPLHLVHGL